MTDNETPWETDITPVNTAIAELAHRNRPHLPAHDRNINEQTLDAMLRIEETLVSILDGMRHFAKMLPKETADEARQLADVVVEDGVVTKDRTGKSKRK